MTDALIREKVAQATAILNELDIDLWLTYVRETTLTPDPVLPLIVDLDFTWHTALLLSRTGRHVAVVGHFDAENVRRLGIFDRVIDYHEGISGPLVDLFHEFDPRQIAINMSRHDVAADGLTHGLYLTLEDMLAGTPYAERLVPAEEVIAALRGRKSAAEVALMRQAAATTIEAFAAVEAYARPGMSQRHIADFVHSWVDGRGLAYAWPKPYNPIVTCGPNSPVGHAEPGEVSLERGHLLHMDLGIKQQDYCSDMQRMWYVLAEGETSPPPDVRQAFDVVRAAIEAGAAALRPGARGWEVDAAARRVIVDNGYPEYMHAFGHLLGRVAHDGATVLGPRWERYAGICERVVEVGNVFTLELHVPVPGRGVMSLEEDVLVTADGLDYLAPPQTSLWTIR